MQALDASIPHALKPDHIGKAVKSAAANILPGHAHDSNDTAMQATGTLHRHKTAEECSLVFIDGPIICVYNSTVKITCTQPPNCCCLLLLLLFAATAAAKVFGAIQGHWLSACLGVMLQLRVADILVDHTSSSSSHANAPAGQDAANGNGSAADHSGGMSIEQVSCGLMCCAVV
jgi:hypothetical protein